MSEETYVRKWRFHTLVTRGALLKAEHLQAGGVLLLHGAERPAALAEGLLRRSGEAHLLRSELSVRRIPAVLSTDQL